MKALALAISLSFVVAVAHAAIDAYEFPDDETALRYQMLIAELRCPQCLNTNLAGSDAMIAKDLRREVHRMIIEGRSNVEVESFMYERYGDFILYRPRFNLQTIVLWCSPLFFLMIGALIVWRVAIRGRHDSAVLSEVDHDRLSMLLRNDDE